MPKIYKIMSMRGPAHVFHGMGWLECWFREYSLAFERLNEMRGANPLCVYYIEEEDLPFNG